MAIIKIKKAFERKLLELPEIDTSYEGDDYQPSINVPYQRLLHLPEAPLNPTLGDTYRREIGVFTVFLNYPSSMSIEAKERAEQIQALFFRGNTLVEDGLEVIIQRTPAIASGTQAADRYILPVRIQYFASVVTG
jgi:hypothetical protein